MKKSFSFSNTFSGFVLVVIQVIINTIFGRISVRSRSLINTHKKLPGIVYLSLEICSIKHTL